MRYLVHDAEGQILKIGLAPDSMMLDVIAAETQGTVRSVPEDVAFNDDTHYVNIETQELVPKPPKPEGNDHDWDWPSKSWVLNIDRIRQRKHREIEAERDRRLSDPIIEYDGIRLNAGPLDKQNLQDKITATASRIARGTPTPPQMLVWKDYDNVIHTFADLPTYKTWLEGFAIALEERGMQAWSWSWQKKDQLAALTTAEEVLAFDPKA